MPQYMANWLKTENCFPERSEICNTKCYDELDIANRSFKRQICVKESSFLSTRNLFPLDLVQKLAKENKTNIPKYFLGP